MARFFVAASNIFGGIAYLNESDEEHVKALRIKDGETFTVCDGNGKDYTCILQKDENGKLGAKVIDICSSVGEPSIACKIFAAFSKSDKLEHVVQKAVELGAAEIVLFPSNRCVSRPEGAALIKKTARLSKIAEEAAKQSRRGIIPRVTVAPTYKAAIDMAADADVPLFCYEDEKTTSLKQALALKNEFKTVSIVTGAEGGFEPDEAEYAVSAGMISVTMGPRILRCETAPLCALTAVMYHTGNL